MKKGEEYYIQSAAVQWFRLIYPDYLIFSVPLEATWRNKFYFEGLGSLAGVSDTIIVLPGKVLFVEFKSKRGRQSTEQKQFELKIKSLGLEYYLVRSFEEFQELIKTNLNLI